MLGVAAAGFALVAFLFVAVLQLSGFGGPPLQGFVAYLGFAAIALVLLDLANRRPQR